MAGHATRDRSGTGKASRPYGILLALLLFVLGACSLPGSAAPVVKLGVIAPFEGHARALGYAILPAVKEAVAETNSSGALGAYRVAVVAFNDNLEAAGARGQAEALALDPDVIGVVGPFSTDTIAAAGPVLASHGLMMLPVAVADPTGIDFSADQSRTKEAARTLLRALAADIQAHGRPTRPAVTIP